MLEEVMDMEPAWTAPAGHAIESIEFDDLKENA